MSWQDVVFTVGNVFFAVALVPTLRDRRARVPRSTSLPNAIVLATFVVPEVTLGLIGTATMSAFMALGWAAIARFRAVHVEAKPHDAAMHRNGQDCTDACFEQDDEAKGPRCVPSCALGGHTSHCRPVRKEAGKHQHGSQCNDGPCREGA